jgi:sporulation protein YlmC with PRC-barrel domain
MEQLSSRTADDIARASAAGPVQLWRKLQAMKKIITAVSFAALMAIPAMAQDSTTEQMKNAPPAVAEPNNAVTVPKGEKMTTGEISASELLDENVVNAANETVGDVNDVILDADGKLASIVVGVGGFLGMGEKDVALSFDQLTFARDNDNGLVVSTNATKESLQAAPAYTKPDKRS